MLIPPENSKIWERLVTGEVQIEFNFLAVKIFLGSANRLYKVSPNSLQPSVLNLYKLFEKNQQLPTLKKDIILLATYLKDNKL